MTMGLIRELTLLLSPKFLPLRRFGDGEFRLLDVGCGNHSASKTKTLFKNCLYYGLDRDNYNNTTEDYNLMEEFYRVDLESGSLAGVPNGFFDAIIMSHVIEHLHDGLAAILMLSSKLKPGGIIYVEFPSVRSLGLPSMPGTLHFCDDTTHIRLYDVKEVVNTLLTKGLKIVKAGTRRNVMRIAITPFAFVYLKYVRRRPYATAFWDILGFASFVFAQKNTESGVTEPA